MMNFREATRADRDAILALRAQCFAGENPEKLDPRFWDWEFARARIFVGEEEGRLATHFALVEQPRGRALAVDAMTAPWARGRGAFSKLVAHAMAATQFPAAMAFQIRDAVLGGMLRGGWAAAGRAPVLMRPALFRHANTARALTRDDVPWMADISGRLPEFLTWRFFDSPLWKYEILGNENAWLAGRKTILKGIRTYAIADLAWREARAAHRLIGNTDTEGCRLMAALASPSHPAFRLLLLRGFLPGPHWFRILVHPPELASRPWPVLWADTDHL